MLTDLRNNPAALMTLLLVAAGCDRGLVVDETPPAAIVDLRVVEEAATADSITLAWTAVGNDGRQQGTRADRYVVYQHDRRITAANLAEATSADVAQAPAAAGEAETLVVTGLQQDTYYYFAMQVFDSRGNVSLSDDQEELAQGKTLDLTPPGAVVSFVASDARAEYGGTIDLMWQNPTDPDFAGVIVVRSVGTVPATPRDGQEIFRGQGTTYQDTGLVDGTQYQYAAWAFDDELTPNSSVSPALATATPTDTTPPAAITPLSPTSESTSAIRLTWTAVGDDGSTGRATRYDIVYSLQAIDAVTFDSATFVPDPPVPQGSGTPEVYSVGGLLADTEYWFGVRVTDDSANSRIATAGPVATRDISPPLPLVSFGATDTGTGGAVQLSWSFDAAMTDYIAVTVVRRTDRLPTDISEPGTATICDANQTDCVDTNVLPGNTYYYAAATHDEVPNYSSLLTSSVLVTDPSFVPPITGFAVTDPQLGNRLSLSWSNPAGPNFDHLIILRRNDTWPTSATDPSALPAAYNGTGVSMDDIGLIDGTTYYYAAYAISPASTSSAQARASATPTDQTAPDAVYIFQAVNTGQGAAVELSWNNPTLDWDGVVIRRKQGGYPVNQTDGIFVYQGIGTGLIDTPLTDGIEYFYAAWSFDDASPANWSAPAQGSATPADTTAPSQVAGFAAVAQDDGTIQVSWTLPSPSAGFVGVKILRKTTTYPSAQGDALAVEIYNGTGTTWNDAGLSVATRYFYSAYSYDSVPNYTAAVQSSDITRTGFATNLALVAEQNGIGQPTGNVIITWNNPTDAEFYGARVVLGAGASPTGPNAGVTVCDDAGANSCIDTAAGLNQQNYYGVFAHNATSRFALGVFADIFVTDDVVAPQPVTGLTATPVESPAGTTVDLSWVNPGDPDLMGVRVLRKLGAFPASPTDAAAVVVYNGLGTTVSDAVSSEGQAHFYRAWAYDEVPNYAAAAEVSTTPPVSVAIVGFAANPPVLWIADSSTALDWTTQGIASCSIDNGIGSVGTAGPLTAFPATTTVYAITCQGWRGPVTASVKVVHNLAEVQWVVGAGGSGQDSAYAVSIAPNSDILLTGFFTGTATFGAGEAGETTLVGAGVDVYVARLTSSGVLIWVEQISSDRSIWSGSDVLALPGGGILASGRFAGTVTFAPGKPEATSFTAVDGASIGIDVFLAQYDDAGTLLWIKRTLGGWQPSSMSIDVTPSGSVVMTGYYMLDSNPIRGPLIFGPGEPNEVTLPEPARGVSRIRVYRTIRCGRHPGVGPWHRRHNGDQWDCRLRCELYRGVYAGRRQLR